MPNLEAKKALVAEVAEKLKASQGTIIVDYRGLTVAEVTELRNKAREQGIEYKVYKNSTLRFAAKEAGLEGLLEALKGPTAIAFCEADPIAPAKLMVDFAKDHEKLEIKSGAVDGKVVSVAEIDALAKLPSREELIAQTLRGLNSPIQGFVNVLNGTIKGLVVALSAIADKKKEEEAA